MKPASQRIEIFDTTLRDGQQCPGAGMSFEANLEYARLAAKLGVDVLEAGFPAASELDFQIVRSIVELYSTIADAPIVAALCQLREEQIERTIEALIVPGVSTPARLHVYVPVAPALMAASLGEKANKEAILKDTANFVARAFAAGLEVEFSPEGYSRMGENFDFVTDLISAAVGAGATVINCPDTIGGASALEGSSYFVNHMRIHAERIANLYPQRSVTWSVHCHNDFGLAVQNSIDGIVHGPARQIEGCINGVGERAGNAALEQVALIIDKFGDSLEQPLHTNLRLEHLGEICAFVARQMLPQQPHSPVSGANAARHSSGGHTNAVLRNPLVYQPFDPRALGMDISLAFGPLSGGNHAKSIIQSHGYQCQEDEKAEVAQFIKNFHSERRKGITDEELMQAYFAFRAPIRIDEFDYSRSKNRSQIDLNGRFFSEAVGVHEEYEGKDSALAALKQAIDRHFSCEIESHQSRSEGSGITAVSVSTIVLRDGSGAVHSGMGRDQDIEISAMKALIDAVNQAYVDAHFRI
jgi:2-isopropylmalate synthase